MRRPTLALILLATALPVGAIAATAADPPAGFWTTPTITGAGRIHYLPKSAYRPDPNATYKVVFSLTKAASAPDQVNPALDHVARTVNLYVRAGVPLQHLKFVAIAYGAATPLALDDVQYRKLYHIANPNLPVITQLRKDGIDVAVCGQAWAEHHFDYAWLSPRVTLALSSLTTITELEQQGYGLMPL